MSKSYVIEGSVKWAKVIAPAPNFNKNGEEWSVEVSVSDKDVEELTSRGIDEEVYNLSANKMQSRYKLDIATGKRFLKLKKKVMKDNNGNILYPMVVVGPDAKTPVTGLVGNGSVARVQVSLRTFKDKKGVERQSMGLGYMQIIDLNVYDELPSEFKPVEGYVAPTPAASDGPVSVDDVI